MNPVAKAAAAAISAAAVLALASWLAYPSVQIDDVAEVMAQQISQETKAAKGFGSDQSRVDSQITLAIPAGRAQDVYQYLKGKYVAQDRLLEDQFPGARLSGKQMSDVSQFTDRYFDTPSLDLYRHKNSCRYRKRINTTHPDDRKNGRELVQMKVTPPGKFDLRNELKYEVKRSTRSKTIDDVHPVLQLIDKDLRADFRQVYAAAGIDAYALRHIFTIEQTRSRGYLDLNGKNFMSFSVDEGAAWSLGSRGVFASVDLGLVEVAYTEADAATRKQMWEIRDAIVADLLRQFPDLRQNSDSKYAIVLDQLMRKIPVLPLLLRLRLV
jgi:hypothetical protein